MTSYINITVTILHKMIHSASINNSMYARCRIIVNFFCINKKNEENKQDLQKSPKAESEGKSPFACPSESANSQGFKQKCHYF